MQAKVLRLLCKRGRISPSSSAQTHMCSTVSTCVYTASGLIFALHYIFASSTICTHNARMQASLAPANTRAQIDVSIVSQSCHMRADKPNTKRDPTASRLLLMLLLLLLIFLWRVFLMMLLLLLLLLMLRMVAVLLLLLRLLRMRPRSLLQLLLSLPLLLLMLLPLAMLLLLLLLPR